MAERRATPPRTNDEPATAGKPPSAEEPHEHHEANFYRGLIVFLDRARGRGTIRSATGRLLHFQFPSVRVVGAPLGGRTPGLDWLRQGDSVGFDVGWTSRGLRVTLINPAAHHQRD